MEFPTSILQTLIGKGDWNAIVNGYWSPFYPLAPRSALHALHASMYWESSIVHAVNFLIFLGTCRLETSAKVARRKVEAAIVPRKIKKVYRVNDGRFPVHRSVERVEPRAPRSHG